MIKISLIIPVYNVEQYLEKCLNSCVEQDIPLDEYEIIVINDGSKDNSLSIALQFEKEYENIKVFSQENQGLSAARNKGLSLAKGEYVWFIDSDDWIQNNCLKKITDKCFDEKLDALAVCSADLIRGKLIRRFEYIDYGVLPGKEVMINIGLQVCVPFTIYRKKFLEENTLHFYNGIFHEDSEFTPRAYYLAEKVSSVNDILYFVNQNPTSITRTVNPKKSYDIIKVCNSLSEFSKFILPKYKFKFDNIISTNINNALYNSFEMNRGDKDKLNNIIYENRHLFIHLRKSNILKYKIEGYIFNLLPKMTVQVYQFLQMFNKGKTVSKI